MSRINWRTVKEEGPDDSLPLLEAVLEHYGVQLSDRRVQMVSCPLHEDTNPSMSIDLNKQVWNCHSCGQAGNSLAVIVLKEVTNYRGARALASAFGLSTGGSGGSRDELPEVSYTRGRRVPGEARDKPGRGGYRPSWRRP